MRRSFSGRVIRPILISDTRLRCRMPGSVYCGCCGWGRQRYFDVLLAAHNRRNCADSQYQSQQEDRLMSLRINSVAPDFVAETTQGKISFHDWIGNGWAILFSHPKDFTPVCTTELGYMAGLQPEFDKRGTKIIGL